MVRVFGVLSLTLAASLTQACHTTAVRDDGSPARRTGAIAASSSPSVSSPSQDAAVAVSPPVSQPITALAAVIEGACPSARAYTVGGKPALVMNRDAWIVDPDGARALYRMGPPVYDAFSGTTITSDHMGDVGGAQESQAWIQLRLSTGRGEDSSELLVRAPPWRSLKTPRGGSGFFALTHIIPQPDGSLWAYGTHSMYLDIPGDIHDGKSNNDKYFAFSALGEPLSINLPGPDMRNAVRMASGELVTGGRTGAGKPVLRRWSPAKKVDDLVVATAAAESTDPPLAVGTNRAVLLASKRQHAFYNYTGDKLEASGLSARLHDVASWLLTSSDELMVTAADGALLVESKDGTISEEKVPEPGRLAAEPSVPWFIANSGAIYTREEKGWRKVALPDGPWAAETHPPSRVEWIKTVGGETWASAVRTDAGFGLRKPGEVRVLYSSKPRVTPLRCGAPFPTTTLAPLPPRPGPSCTSLAVVVLSETEPEQKSEYPKIGAALKGDALLGESLTFVEFGTGANRLLAIAAPTREVANEIVKRLERASPHAPELVCGTPNEVRRLRFGVKSGEFTSP